jgi:transposase
VVAAVSAGVSCREAAQRFSIGVSSVVRWAQWFRRTGSVAAKPMGGDRNSRLKDERDWLLARIAAAPDLPLHGIRRELAARHVQIGYGTILRFFAKEKITFKKIVSAAEQRQCFRDGQKQLDPKRLVFIDETCAKTNMAPTHGRCRRGQRLYAKVPPAGHWKTTTFIAALRHNGVTAPFVLDGPINGECFLA